MIEYIYLIYEKETNELYAFTCEKNIYKLFKKTRNMNMYITKKIDYRMDVYSNLNKIHNDLYLSLFKFEKMSIPLTHVEGITIINITLDFTSSKIYTLPFVNPEIFKNKYNVLLKDINYESIYNVFSNNMSDPIEIKESYFRYFLLFYEKLLNVDTILNIYEKGNLTE